MILKLYRAGYGAVQILKRACHAHHAVGFKLGERYKHVHIIEPAGIVEAFEHLSVRKMPFL